MLHYGSPSMVSYTGPAIAINNLNTLLNYLCLIFCPCGAKWHGADLWARSDPVLQDHPCTPMSRLHCSHLALALVVVPWTLHCLLPDPQMGAGGPGKPKCFLWGLCTAVGSPGCYAASTQAQVWELVPHAALHTRSSMQCHGLWGSPRTTEEPCWPMTRCGGWIWPASQRWSTPVL